jgi:tyrosinase
MKKILAILGFTFISMAVNAQHIRKNYLEMTASEYTDFNAALQLLWNGGSTAVNNHAWFANTHNTHFFTNIHSNFPGVGENFTSFHRFFLLHWELLLKNTNASYAYLSVPYWDWRTDPPKSQTSGVSSALNPTFWEYSFLPIANFSTWTGLSRGIPYGNGSALPSLASYNTSLGKTIFIGPTTPPTNNFSQDLETNNHGIAHVWVGGVMGGGSSPLDPVFFLHHAMVDKIWQDWEDQLTGIQSVFPNFSFPPTPFLIPGYKIANGWIDNIDASTSPDSRSIPFRYTTANSTVNYDVWYAENGKVILDGSNGVDYLVNGNGKIYRYTTNGSPVLGGSMFIGDLYRDPSNNILPDTKGGFWVGAGTTAHFRAGGDINLLPGCAFYANSSEVTFAIITTPNGF